MNIHRKIIEINEERCNGCGQCVLDCAEGAIAIVDGKAKVISDHLCDGLGACIGACPQDALHIVERLAPPFDEKAVHAHLEAQKQPPLACGCPGSLAQQLHRPAPHSTSTASGSQAAASGCPSARPFVTAAEGTPAHASGHKSPFAPATGGGVGHWPVKLRLMPASSPFLAGAHLLLAADCAPVVCQNFAGLASGKVVLTSCPKFEDTEALSQKLTEICLTQRPARITVLRMEVPCCQRLGHWVNEAVARAEQECGHAVPVTHLCLGRDGKLLGLD